MGGQVSARTALAVCVDEHVKGLPLSPAWMAGAPLLHVIRDPLEVCASSYQYALRANESWLRVPHESLRGLSYQQYYRSVPLREGLATECRRCFKELRQMASLYEATARTPRTLTVRFEELTDAYDATVSRMLEFAGLASGDAVRSRARFEKLLVATRKHDLSRRAATSIGVRTAGHVSDASQKAELRSLLLQPSVGVASEVRELRRRMGYEEAGKMGMPSKPDVDVARAESAAAARQRRWLLTTMCDQPEGAVPSTVPTVSKTMVHA